MNKYDVIVDFVAALYDAQDLDSIKYVILAVAADDTVLFDFVKKVFELVEQERPLLLEEKASVAI